MLYIVDCGPVEKGKASKSHFTHFFTHLWFDHFWVKLAYEQSTSKFDIRYSLSFHRGPLTVYLPYPKFN